MRHFLNEHSKDGRKVNRISKQQERVGRVFAFLPTQQPTNNAATDLSDNTPVILPY